MCLSGHTRKLIILEEELETFQTSGRGVNSEFILRGNKYHLLTRSRPRSRNWNRY